MTLSHLKTHRSPATGITRLAVAGLCTLAVGAAAIPACAADDDDSKSKAPAIVTPGTAGSDEAPGRIPSDATVIFDGKNLDGFTRDNGQPPQWIVEDGVLKIKPRTGSIITKQEIDDAQIHIEFATPTNDDGKGQGKGNSGLYLQQRFELQVLDSWKNDTNPNQQCASLYKNYSPFVNASRAPGEWQTYDIIFHGPKLEADKVVKPAVITALHNGVLVQYNRGLTHGTGAATNRQLIEAGPILLQDHGDEVQFRNFWVRDIPPRSDESMKHVDMEKSNAEAKVVRPGGFGTSGKPPADAVVLFDGTSLDHWTNDKWKLADGYIEVTGGGQNLKQQFGSVQLHIEWATPNEVKGKGQGRGNSGVYIHGTEIQVLDSYDNETYFDGQAGAIYKQHPPLVNASRPPGEWQTYDIIYTAAKFGDDGKLVRPASFTAFHNGVLIQDHSIIKSPGSDEKNSVKQGSLHLQDHGNPVRYRNIWMRKLD